ncbi:MAG TPA: GerMN domain-containing protein [Terriglobia bacterium]|nr:GerMN domain-containing protein [Terriglobia bacterium]
MTRRAGMIAIALLLVILGGGFVYLRVLTRRAKLESPEHGEEGARTQLREAALQSNTGALQTITLYFPSDDDGQLQSESRQIAWATSDTDRIRQVMLALIEGSYKGLRRPLPPTTELRAVFLTPDGTAYLDFSSNALAVFAPGIQSETLAIYSIVNSLAANIPSVLRVKILVQGQEVETLNGHADLGEIFVPDLTRNQPASP